MTTTNDTERVRERMAELGRKSGIARRRRRSRTWEDWYFELVDGDPEAFARRLHGTGNGAALVKGLELALEARKANVAARMRELDERERALTQKERSAEQWTDWAEMARQRYERAQAETEELKRQRDELRDAIEREAEAHDMELVEVDADAAVA